MKKEKIKVPVFDPLKAQINRLELSKEYWKRIALIKSLRERSKK